MTGLELRPLRREEVGWVYRWEMKETFPRAERRSLGHIRAMMDRGVYDGWGIFRREELLGYAFLWRGPSFVLLDYLAVCRGKRGAGLGSALLEGLQGRYSGAAGILAEAEAPEGASEEEQDLRRRRLDFYRRLGFAELKYRAEIFTVRYAVLAWSAGGAPDEAAAQEAHAALYRGELPGPLFRRFIHIPAPPEDNERDIL